MDIEQIKQYADSQIMTKQQKLDKIDQEVQRQKKRILRSKILRLIDHYLNIDCEKYIRIKHEQNNLDKLEKEFTLQKENDKAQKLKKENQMHKEFEKANRQRLDKEYHQERFKAMTFSKQSAHAFSAQTLRGKSERQHVHLVETRQVNIVQQICQHLDEHEVLQIGEDPAYFIVKDKHKKIKGLLDSELWNAQADFGGEKKIQQPIGDITVQQQKKYQRLYDLKQDRSEKKYEFDTVGIHAALVEYVKEDNRGYNQDRRDEFEIRREKRLQDRRIYIDGKREKLDIKEMQGDQRKQFMIDHQALIVNKKHQKMYMDQYNIQKKKQEIEEKQEIQRMNLDLKDFCIERQIKKQQQIILDKYKFKPSKSGIIEY